MSDDKEKTMELNRAWYKAKEDLAAAKAHELDLRKQVIAENFGEITSVGTKKQKLGHTADLVLTVPAKADVNLEKFESMRGYLEAQGLIGDDSLFRLKPSVSLTAYKYLEDSVKIVVDDIITHKLGSPTLDVKVVKD